MCGRLTLLTDYDALLDLLEVDRVAPGAAESYGARYNVAPTQWHWMVMWAPDGGGGRLLQPSRWGLINRWSKDRSFAARQINARAETVEDKAAWREAFQRRRCVVPASGFYEWSGPKSARHPHYIHPRNEPLLRMAGLYAVWRAPETGELEHTFSVLTTAANASVAPLHDRMPVLLEPAAARLWLDPQAPEDELRDVLRPAPDDLLEEHTVSTAVNSPHNDGPELLDPARPEPPRQQSLF